MSAGIWRSNVSWRTIQISRACVAELALVNVEMARRGAMQGHSNCKLIRDKGGYCSSPL